ncbi:hypothetical protein GCM10028777_10250 [Angustibacter speluncae]
MQNRDTAGDHPRDWVGELLGDVRHVDEQAVRQRVVDLAPEAVPECHHAGITHRSGRRYRTLAASDDVVSQANHCQYELEEGPA